MKKHVIDTGPVARYSRIEKTAIRAALRLMGEICAAHDVGAQMDAGFDGGEWSESAHADACAQECEQAIRRVARMFEIPDWWLENAVFVWTHVQDDCWIEAVTGRAA